MSPIYPLRNRFQELGLTEVFTPIVIKDVPSETTEKLCEEAGTDLGQWLSKDRTEKQVCNLNADLDKALGRLSSGLYNSDRPQRKQWPAPCWHLGLTQASFQPLGVAIAVAKDRGH